MDECWLDVTGSRAVCGDAMNIAEQIRRSVREELGLTVSIGVSFNKVFAKLGSDMKKQDAITEISSDAFREKVKSVATPMQRYDLLRPSHHSETCAVWCPLYRRCCRL